MSPRIARLAKENLVSQLRSGPPSECEDKLCSALIPILGRNVHDLSGIVAELNKTDVRSETDSSWTAESFQAVLRKYGTGPERKPAPPITDPNGLRLEASQPSAGCATTESCDQIVRRLVATGVRNKWYCVAPSRLVADDPVAVTRLGEKLVLWRDGDGHVHVQRDSCPHRGAPLSLGSVQDGLLTCAYHGVQVDGGGRVVRVPAMPACHLSGQHLVKTYPCIEHYQGIFAYFGDELHPEPPQFEFPVEFVSDDWTGFVYTKTWRGNYQYIYDNLCDVMHAPFLHAQSFALAYGSKSDEIQVTPTPTGFEVERKGQKDLNFDWMEYGDTGGPWIRVGVFYPPAGGPGGLLRIMCFMTPIDESSTQIHFWRMRKVQGWQADLWRFLFKTRLEALAEEVLEQDRLMVEALPPFPAPENLYQHDVGVSRIRRIFRQAAEAQARDLSETGAVAAQ